jgi:hypothetical protein
MTGFNVNLKCYCVKLITVTPIADFRELRSRDPGNDYYLLDMEVYNENQEFVKNIDKILYVDHAKKYRGRLKAGSKWEGKFVQDNGEKLINLNPCDDKNNNQILSSQKRKLKLLCCNFSWCARCGAPIRYWLTQPAIARTDFL